MFSISGFLILGLVVLLSLAMLWRTRGEGIGLPSIALLSFGYLYLEQPLQLIWSNNMDAFLTDWQVGKGAAIPGVMLAFFMWGWQRGKSRSALPTQTVLSWNPLVVWRYGLVVASVSSLLLLVLLVRSGGLAQAFGGIHGAGIQIEGATAYWFLCPYWIISSIVMMIIATSQMRRSMLRQVILVCFIVGVYLFAILMSSRGFLFAISAAVLVSFVLSRRMRPTLAQASPYWIAAGLAVLMMVAYRQVLHLGESQVQAPTFAQAVTIGGYLSNREVARHSTGIEFVFHAVTLDTIDQKQKYDFGMEWLYLYTVHLIPRVLWPGKPYYFERPGITNEDIHETTGVNVAGGAAPGIVADFYQQIGLLSVALFFIGGRVSARAYQRARIPGNVFGQCVYTMLCAVALNAFTQGIEQLMVFLPYSLIPVFLFQTCTPGFQSRFRRVFGLRSGPRPAAVPYSGPVETQVLASGRRIRVQASQPPGISEI